MRRLAKTSRFGVRYTGQINNCQTTKLFVDVDAFESDTSKFASFFQRVIQLMADNQLPLLLRRQVLVFLIQCFQSFENSTVRTACLKLVTIGIWSHLAHQGKREKMFSEYPALEKLWNSSNKKMVAASEETRRQMESERDLLSTLMRNYVDLLYKIPAEGQGKEQGFGLLRHWLTT